MNRAQIIKKHNSNAKKIKALEEINKELTRQHLLFSDKNQQYREQTEIVGRGKNKEERLVGRVHWNEYFIDEDTNKKILIARSMVVRINNEWVNGY